MTDVRCLVCCTRIILYILISLHTCSVSVKVTGKCVFQNASKTHMNTLKEKIFQSERKQINKTPPAAQSVDHSVVCSCKTQLSRCRSQSIEASASGSKYSPWLSPKGSGGAGHRDLQQPANVRANDRVDQTTMMIAIQPPWERSWCG